MVWGNPGGKVTMLWRKKGSGDRVRWEGAQYDAQCLWKVDCKEFKAWCMQRWCSPWPCALFILCMPTSCNLQCCAYCISIKSFTAAWIACHIRPQTTRDTNVSTTHHNSRCQISTLDHLRTSETKSGLLGTKLQKWSDFAFKDSKW